MSRASRGVIPAFLISVFLPSVALAQNSFVPASDASVVIRYPARISDQALNDYLGFYDDRGFGNYFYDVADDRQLSPNFYQTPSSQMPPRDMKDAGTESIVKSTYFALALYESVKRALPGRKIILQPMEIVSKNVKLEDGAIAVGESWPVTLEEKAAAEYAPAPIYVDVAVHVNPLYRVYTFNEPTTFGRYLAPLVTIRTAPAASPDTFGLLALPAAFRAYTRSVQMDAPANQGMGVTLTEYLDGDQGVPADTSMIDKSHYKNQAIVQPGNVALLPIKQVELPAKGLSSDASNQSLVEDKFVSNYVSLIASAVKNVPYDTATKAGREKYIANYDPELAKRFAGGVLTEADKAKLDCLRQFEQAEWELLADEDETFISDAFYGDWGRSVRQARVVENKAIDEIRNANTSAQMALFAGAMSGMGSLNAGARLTPQQSMQNSMQMMTTAMQMNQSSRESQEAISHMVQSFQSRLDNAYTKTLKFSIVLAGKNIDVEASNLSDLRKKFGAIYAGLNG